MSELVLGVTPLSLAKTYIGIKEVPGAGVNHQIIGFIHQTGAKWYHTDGVGWCGAFMFEICRRLELSAPPFKGWQPLTARQWKRVGEPVDTRMGVSPGFVIVVIEDELGDDSAPGAHVGLLFSERLTDHLGIDLIGGNQGNEVNVTSFATKGKTLTFRRLVPDPGYWSDFRRWLMAGAVEV